MILKILKHFAKYIYYKQTHTQIFKKGEFEDANYRQCKRLVKRVHFGEPSQKFTFYVSGRAALGKVLTHR